MITRSTIPPINRMKTLFVLWSLFVSLKAFAYDDEEDKIDPEFSFYMILAGLGLLGVGALISQVKISEGFGKIIGGIGFFIGGFGVLGLALILLEWAMKTAVTLALYIGAIALAGYILYHIYLWLFGKKKE